MYMEQKIMDAKIMQANGKRQKAITKVLGVAERAVRKYLKTPPGRKTRKKRAGKLDAYWEYIITIIEDNPHYNIERCAYSMVSDGLRFPL